MILVPVALENINWRGVRNDIIAGITVAFVALPLALSYGVLSGMGAAAGVYGAIFCGIFASIFGGTKAQISGPASAMTVVLADTYDKVGVEGLIACMLAAAVFQILIGVFKLGRFIHLIPQPAIVGFTNGIGILILVKQYKHFMDSPILALIVIAIMFLLPYVTKKVPAALVALVVGTAVSMLWLPANMMVGEIPVIVPQLHIPDFTALDLWVIAKTGALLAILGAIETLLSSLVVDEMTNTSHDSDREMVGQGIANLVSAGFGNLMGCGALVRSAVAVNAGGRGRLTGIVHSIVLILLVVVFGPIAAQIPMAVLAGILIVTAIRMIEYKESYVMSSASKEAQLVILVTTILTIFLDLTTAILVGTMISSFMILISLGNSYIKEYHIDCEGLEQRIKSFTVEGALFFGISDTLVNTILKKAKGADIVLLNMHNTAIIDATGVVVLGRIKDKLKAKGKKLIIAGLREETFDQCCKMGFLDESDRELALGKIPEAVAYAKEYAWTTPSPKDKKKKKDKNKANGDGEIKKTDAVGVVAGAADLPAAEGEKQSGVTEETK